MVNGSVVAIFVSPIDGGKMEEVEIAEAHCRRRSRGRPLLEGRG